MSKRDDGGPAFPTPEDRFGEYSASMTLRDWFAGQALAGATPDGPTHLAEYAYAVADAMLAERSK